MTSIFQRFERVWCEVCERRTLKMRTRHGVCQPCIDKALEESERDYEMASLKGYYSSELDRI